MVKKYINAAVEVYKCILSTVVPASSAAALTGIDLQGEKLRSYAR